MGKQLKKHMNKKNIWAIIIVIVIVIIACAALWFFQKGNLNTVRTEQKTNEVEKNQSAQQGTIKYNSSPTVMKIIPREESAEIDILNIGSITEGQFKDKTLALAFYNQHNDEEAYRIYGVSSYFYFVSDNVGNPIAWDKDFLHNNVVCMEECDMSKMEEVVGLVGSLEKDLSFLPKELSLEKNITTNDQKASFLIFNDGLLPPDVLKSSYKQIGLTKSGWKIVKMEEANSSYETVLPRISYFIILPFGKIIKIFAEPNFVDANDVPQLTWTTGTKAIASYRYGEYAYGWEDCYDGVSGYQLQSILVPTGKTIKGDSVYELDAKNYPKVYECLHEKTKRYVYDDKTRTGSYEDSVSYEDFVPSHPVFFWKHPSGDLMVFVRSDVVPAAEKAKPVIYLYPEQTEKINVKVFPVGGFTKTDPDYGNGWIVNATPSGEITNLQNNKNYPYLFWEGGKEGIVETPAQGFVIAKENIDPVLNEKLSQFGLNEKERADFLEFWTPKLSRAPYYFVTFISRSEIDRVSPMSISPQPDTVIRVLMDYKPLTAPINVEPLSINQTERKGFTVVEWGGIVRD